MDPEALHEVAVSLYGLRPDRFTAARTRASLQARDAGDRELMSAIKALRRPSVSAWVVNLLVRRQPELIGQVVELGDSLRQAQALLQGDALRDLGHQRRQLITAVTRQAVGLAEAEGQNITDPVVRQVEETLQAAMTDGEAAEAVRSGLLTRPLSSTGMAGLAEALAVPLGERPRATSGAGTEPPRPSLTVVRDEERERDEAKARVEAAGEAVRAAQKAFDKATRKRAKGEAKLLQLEAELEEVRRRLAEAEEQTERAAERMTELDARVEESAAHLADARAEADAAAAALDDLV
jgi:DNA repair exonuclease SbcCD ATPase subunit